MCVNCSKLMVVLKYYIESVDPAKMESLCRAVKSLEYMFKFIIRSRFLFAAYVCNSCFIFALSEIIEERMTGK